MPNGSPLPTRYEGFLPSGTTYTVADTTTPTRPAPSVPHPLHQELIQQASSLLTANYNALSNSYLPSPNSALHRSPRVVRSPSPSSTNSTANRPALEGVSVKNKPYDFIAPANEGGDGQHSMPNVYVSDGVGGIASTNNQNNSTPHATNSHRSTSPSESPTRRALNRAKEAAADDPEALILAESAAARRLPSGRGHGGVSVKNQHYDFVSPHDVNHTIDAQGVMHHRPSNSAANSPGSAQSQGNPKRSPRSQSITLALRTAVEGALEGRSPVRRTISPPKSHKGSGVSVRNEPYDFVGPAEAAHGGIDSHTSLARSPSSSQATLFQAAKVENPPNALSGFVYRNERHDYSEAVEHGGAGNSLTGEPVLSATMPPESNSTGFDKPRQLSRSPDAALPSYAAHDFPNHSSAVRAHSSSLTRMVADIMSNRGSGSEEERPTDLHAYAAEALANAQQRRYGQDRYRADPNVGIPSSNISRVTSSNNGYFPSHLVSSVGSTPPPMQPPARARSPSQRPHVDICQVVSTVAVDRKASPHGYVSPRRQVVSAASQQAQTLLDTARTTVAMLTEELVGLRRAHAQLQRDYNDQTAAAAAGRKVSSQVEQLYRQLEAKDKELNAERTGRMRIEAELAKIADRADAVADNNEKLKRERAMLLSKLHVAEQEVIAVKVTAKSAIDQMAAALTSMSE